MAAPCRSECRRHLARRTAAGQGRPAKHPTHRPSDAGSTNASCLGLPARNFGFVMLERWKGPRGGRWSTGRNVLVGKEIAHTLARLGKQSLRPQDQQEDDADADQAEPECCELRAVDHTKGILQ